VLPKTEFAANYQEIVKAFGKETLERQAVPFVCATGEQVLRLHELTAKLNKAAVIERLGSYGAETFEDLSEANAAAIIAKLEKRNGGK